MNAKSRSIVAGALLVGWFVVTYSGHTVAGPYAQLATCSDVAKAYAARYSTISPICHER